MKKAKYALVTLFFGLTLAAVGFDRTSNATPVNQPAPAAGETLRIPASAPALELLAPDPHPQACLKNTCLGTRPCSMCCAGDGCVERNGCFETGLACS